jgi:hypothetical protein
MGAGRAVRRRSMTYFLICAASLRGARRPRSSSCSAPRTWSARSKPRRASATWPRRSTQSSTNAARRRSTRSLVPPPRSSVVRMEHSAAPNPTRTPFILTHFEDVPLVESWTRGGVPPSSTTSRGLAEAAAFLHGQVGGKMRTTSGLWSRSSPFSSIRSKDARLSPPYRMRAAGRGISARQRAARRARAPGGGPAGIGSARPDGRLGRLSVRG